MKTSWMLQYKCKGADIKSVCSNRSELIINFKIRVREMGTPLSRIYSGLDF